MVEVPKTCKAAVLVEYGRPSRSKRCRSPKWSHAAFL